MLIIGSLALNHHMQNKGIRMINDLDIVIQDNHFQDFMDNIPDSWKITPDFKSEYKESFVINIDNFLPIYVEFDLAKNDNSNEKLLSYVGDKAKYCCSALIELIETFASHLVMSHNMALVNHTYAHLKRKYGIMFTNHSLEFLKKTIHIDDNGSLLDKLSSFKDNFAPVELLHVIKSSHKYKKFENIKLKNGLNQSHVFEKTKADIVLLNEIICSDPYFVIHFHFETKSHLPQYQKWLSLFGFENMLSLLEDIYNQRSNEVYQHQLPKLNVDKKQFFDDRVQYIYDHDSIHEVVALFVNDKETAGKPAYTYYMKDDQEVMTDKYKFYNSSDNVKLLGVMEEAMVLSLERFCFLPANKFHWEHGYKGLVPFAFNFCLKKVCTTITGGYFREYAYTYYHEAMNRFHALPNFHDFVEKHKNMLKPFERNY